MPKSFCSLCKRTFGGRQAFGLHLKWHNKDHTRGPDGNYKRCVDPATIRDLSLRDGVWVQKWISFNSRRSRA